MTHAARPGAPGPAPPVESIDEEWQHISEAPIIPDPKGIIRSISTQDYYTYHFDLLICWVSAVQCTSSHTSDLERKNITDEFLENCASNWPTT